MTIPNTSFASKLIGVEIRSVEPVGSGHIHQTFKLNASNGDAYILQKINNGVFTNVPMLKENIQKVLDHIRRRKRDSETILTMLVLKNEKLYFLDDNGDYWRAFKYVLGSKTYDKIETYNLAFEAGKAYGSFLSTLNDFPIESLYETLPGFHDLNHRINQFEQSVTNDSQQRLNGIESDIEFVRSRSARMKRILELGNENMIPLRVTHNDTKINNVLFDQNDKAICVIDLDTVMPGYIHYDFGDTIRTGAASSLEDEKDKKKMYIKLDLFKAYSEGFLSKTINFLTPAELSELYFAPQLMTYTIGLRFLTDFLNGDIYFKTAYPDHNLVRWKAQRQLLQSMEQNEQEMKNIIQDIIQLHNKA